MSINEKIKIEERLFSLSPSFYAIISGALISVAINLSTSLIITNDNLKNMNLMIFSTILIFLSSIGFANTSLVLEQVRSYVEITANNKNAERITLYNLISSKRKILWLSSIISVVSFLISIVMLFWAKVI